MKKVVVCVVSMFFSVAAFAAGKHHYVLKDGDYYGYERQLSELDRKTGSVAPEVLMVRYVGQRNGTHQVVYHQRGIRYAEVYECATPCEFIKVMTFQASRLTHTDRYRATPGALGWSMLQDAMNGNLVPMRVGENRNKYAWFSERDGLTFTPIKGAPSN